MFAPGTKASNQMKRIGEKNLKRSKIMMSRIRNNLNTSGISEVSAYIAPDREDVTCKLLKHFGDNESWSLKEYCAEFGLSLTTMKDIDGREDTSIEELREVANGLIKVENMFGPVSGSNKAIVTTYVHEVFYPALKGHFQTLRLLLQHKIQGTSSHGVADGAVTGTKERIELICTCTELKNQQTVRQGTTQVVAEMVAAYERNNHNGVKIPEIWGVASNFFSFSFLRFIPEDKTIQYYKDSPLTFAQDPRGEPMSLEYLGKTDAKEIISVLKFVVKRSAETLANAKYDEKYYELQVEKAFPKQNYFVDWDGVRMPVRLRTIHFEGFKRSLYKAFKMEGHDPTTKPINKIYIMHQKMEMELKYDQSLRCLKPGSTI
ncbi:small subunit rRNA methyltransferase H [Acrasis kona]|uniref:Small subunit rRNA methyltransferase H n=1 Tax=Acrasis kona TaxID=1008807 RepID=A0AAW2YLS0_9EUKA